MHEQEIEPLVNTNYAHVYCSQMQRTESDYLALVLCPNPTCWLMRPHRYLPTNVRGTLPPPDFPEMQRGHAHNTRECYHPSHLTSSSYYSLPEMGIPTPTRESLVKRKFQQRNDMPSKCDHTPPTPSLL